MGSPPCPTCSRPMGLAETNYGLGSRKGIVAYWYCALDNTRVEVT